MNRNTATQYVPAVNVVNGHHQHHHHNHHQTELKLTIPHFNVPSISTHTLCLNGNGLGGGGGGGGGSNGGTMNSLSSNASTNCGSASGGSSSSTTTTTTTGHSGGPLENLPKKFVSSMRTLFDIMDDKRSGFVRLSDIEARWQDDGSKGLPHGVIDCLRRVTPISGMLSFERFCAGLKICLLRNQTTNDCVPMTSTPAPTIITAKPIGSMGLSAAAAATKLMMRRSSIDSLNSGNSSNSSNNHHRVNSINNINNVNGINTSHLTKSNSSSTLVHSSKNSTSAAAAAVAVGPVNTVQHIKNIHLHMMNNGSDHINQHNNSGSINSDENNNDNNNSNHNSNSNNRKKNCLFYLPI